LAYLTNDKSDVGSGEFAYQATISFQVFQWLPLTQKKLDIGSIGLSQGRDSQAVLSISDNGKYRQAKNPL